MYEVLAGFSSVGFHALQFYARILLDGICNMLMILYDYENVIPARKDR